MFELEIKKYIWKSNINTKSQIKEKLGNNSKRYKRGTSSGGHGLVESLLLEMSGGARWLWLFPVKSNGHAMQRDGYGDGNDVRW